MVKRKEFTVAFDYQGVDDIDSEYLEKIIDYYFEYYISSRKVDIFNFTVRENLDSQDV